LLTSEPLMNSERPNQIRPGIDSAASEPKTGEVETGSGLTLGTKLGPYEILGQIGEGGMGKVFRATDTRLNRSVAIKISTSEFSKRFESEARTISALNHPNICSLYDIGTLESGARYMVTELIDGETLRDWLKKSPAVESRVEIARQVLEALHAAHVAGIVHRDLKPANIMVRFDGYVKVLDFGLAKRLPGVGGLNAQETAATGPTVAGQIIGTVGYMPPEQILGKELDPRSDLFAFGIILYEMLAHRHPWPCDSNVETLHAILHDEPPAAQIAFSGVVDRLLRKNPEERYPSAKAVLEALASPVALQAPSRRALTRLIVLPFRILRGHEASDFLSVSLPDAITTSLAPIDSLVVRSTMAASRFAASSEFDVKTIAEQAQVDAILTGTILSDGENLRVNTQLIEAPDGTILWSDTSRVSLRDIFQLQDDLVHRIVESLRLPLTAGEQHALKQDVPASARGYEFYLRANQLVAAGYNVQNMMLARDLYLQAAEADPRYAPAWACLGRAHRFLAKFGEDSSVNFTRAHEAFQKAFQLNPELALAHNFYTALETDTGRSLEAMERLLKRAQTHRNDPNLLVGLVQACRYGGLLEVSVAAHNRARQLDPHIQTSVAFTYLHMGDFERALDGCSPTNGFIWLPALLTLGREQEALKLAWSFDINAPIKSSIWPIFFRTFLEGDREKSLKALHQAVNLVPFATDPEASYCIACLMAKLNDVEHALEFLSGALDNGYACHYALLNDPFLDSLRSQTQFTELVNRAAEMNLHARTVFRNNGGEGLLGVYVET
jgi:eukaryotic-like serine/threonine-protein kinase